MNEEKKRTTDKRIHQKSPDHRKNCGRRDQQQFHGSLWVWIYSCEIQQRTNTTKLYMKKKRRNTHSIFVFPLSREKRRGQTSLPYTHLVAAIEYSVFVRAQWNCCCYFVYRVCAFLVWILIPFGRWCRCSRRRRRRRCSRRHSLQTVIQFLTLKHTHLAQLWPGCVFI